MNAPPVDRPRPRAIGVVRDQLMSAWAHWDAFEIHRDDGTTVAKASPRPQHAFRIHDARFVGQRYAVLGVGTGIMSHGIWAFDIAESQWSPPVLGRWSDVGVLDGCRQTPFVLFADGADAVRWNLDRREEARRIAAPDAYAGALCPRGRVALAGPTGLQLHAAEENRVRRGEWRGGPPTALAFVGERAVLSGASEGELYLWDAITLQPRASRQLDVREIEHLAVSHDGRRVACCGDGIVHVLDAETLALVEEPVHAEAAVSTETGWMLLTLRGIRPLASS